MIVAKKNLKTVFVLGLKFVISRGGIFILFIKGTEENPQAFKRTPLQFTISSPDKILGRQ